MQIETFVWNVILFLYSLKVELTIIVAQRIVAAKQVCFPRKENGYTHKAHEKVQTSSWMVVHLHPPVKHHRNHICLWVLQGSTPASMVGSLAGMWPCRLFHPSDWGHHRHNKPGLGSILLKLCYFPILWWFVYCPRCNLIAPEGLYSIPLYLQNANVKKMIEIGMKCLSIFQMLAEIVFTVLR